MEALDQQRYRTKKSLPAGAIHICTLSNRKQAISCDFTAYKDRNRIERMFNRLKQFRRIATRYDKTALSFIGFLCLAAAKLWLPSFVNRT